MAKVLSWRDRVRSLFIGRHLVPSARRAAAARPVHFPWTGVEPMELRLLMSHTPLISEFMADNETNIVDEDGLHSDWIEVHNPTANTVNLNGWHLTDNAADLTKWTFPNVSLAPGQYLLVFASGNDRNDPNSELHTNFRLDADGEYLGLVQPDGTTVAWEFSPVYAQQVPNQSYGHPQGLTTTVLVGPAAGGTAFVPADNSLGNSWQLDGFDDSGWIPGSAATGFEDLSTGAPVFTDTFGNMSIGAGDGWTVQTPTPTAPATTAVTETAAGKLRLTSTGINNSFSTRGTAPFVFRNVDASTASYSIQTSVDVASFAGTALAGVMIYDNADGNYGLALQRLHSGATSSFSLQTGGAGATSVAGITQPTGGTGINKYFARFDRNGSTNQWSVYVRFSEANPWQLVKTMTEGVEIPAIADPKPGFLVRTTTASSSINADMDDYQITEGLPSASPIYGPHIGIDLQDEMLNINASAYLRIPFTVAGDPSSFDQLLMRVRYDDGFVAYLNGTEVARANAPVSVAFDSAATASHGFNPVGAGSGYEVFNISQHVGLLQTGDNVLAIQAMNRTAIDKDFFIDAELDAGDVSPLVENQVVFFDTPTPGTANNQGLVPQPIFTRESGTFSGSFQLTMINPSGVGEIRYTLNGNAPTAASTLYTGPITVSTTTRVQAVVSQPARPLSPITFGNFIALNTGLNAVTSDIPIIVIETQGVAIPGTGATNLGAAVVSVINVNEETGRASILDAPEYVGRGGFRDRGSSTGSQPKQSLTFETWGNTLSDVDVAFLGLPPESDWILYAPYEFDRTLMHEPFIHTLSKQIGRYSPRTRFVEVYINEGGGTVDSADYQGVYILEEKIKINENRVDIAELAPTDVTSPNVTGGYIWKIDRADPGGTTVSAGGQTINFVDPEPPQLVAAHITYTQNYINEFVNVLNGANFADPVNGYAKYIDVGAWIDHHLLNVLTMNVDALRLSAYFHKDRNGKIAFGPIWDFDRTLESTDSRDDNPEAWKGTGDATDFFNYPWWGRLFQDPNFWQAYVDRYTELRDTFFSDEHIDGLIDDLKAEVDEAAVRNFAKWTAAAPRFGSWNGEVENMRTWLHRRLDFIDRTFSTPPELNIAPGEVSPGTGFTLGVPANAVNIDTVILSGNVGATALKYIVPADNSLGITWVQPAFNDTSWTSGTYGLGYENSTGYEALISTNVLGQMFNTRTTAYMRSNFNVVDKNAVDGLILRMKYDDGYVAYINGVEVARRNIAAGTPSNTTVASDHADGNAVVYEDVDISAFKANLVNGNNVLAILGANSSSGSSDFLIIPELVSRTVTFGQNPAATVYYTTDGTDPRLPGGGVKPGALVFNHIAGVPIPINENINIFARTLDPSSHGPESAIVNTDWSGPTRGTFIVDTLPGLVISEVNYNPMGPDDDEVNAGFFDGDEFEFIELYNRSLDPIDLSDLSFVNGVEFDFSAAAFSSLAPGARAVIVASIPAFQERYGMGLPVLGAYVGSLENAGETLAIAGSVGEILVEFTYNDAGSWPNRADGNGSSLELTDPDNLPVGISLRTALMEDGSNWRSSVDFHGSPGAAGADPGAFGIVINEILAHTDAPLSDSIELLNTSGAPVDIGGWYLSDATGDYIKFVIPAATILAPGQAITFTEADFNPTPNTPAPGHFGLNGSHGDDVWLLRGDGSEPTHFVDHVDFGPTFNGVSLGRVINGAGTLFPNVSRSLGGRNSGAAIGSVVISEFMYNHPSDSNELEYIELYNSSESSIDIGGWELDGAVEFAFAEPTLIPAGGRLLVMPFDPADPLNAARLTAFQTAYGSIAAISKVGGYLRDLGNGGDTIQLKQPDDPPIDEPFFTPMVLVDEVSYDDIAPWATSADGLGNSLHRIRADVYGNFAPNWVAAPPSLGSVSHLVRGDVDSDTDKDSIDIDTLFDARNSPAPNSGVTDLTNDGFVDSLDIDEIVYNVFDTFYGDATLDKRVSIGDLTILAENFGGPGGWAEGDFNGTDDITIGDLTLLAENFGNDNNPPEELTGDSPAGLQALGDGDSAVSDSEEEEEDSIADILADLGEGLR